MLRPFFTEKPLFIITLCFESIIIMACITYYRWSTYCKQIRSSGSQEVQGVGDPAPSAL
jgi:hypothetical protein